MPISKLLRPLALAALVVPSLLAATTSTSWAEISPHQTAMLCLAKTDAAASIVDATKLVVEAIKAGGATPTTKQQEAIDLAKAALNAANLAFSTIEKVLFPPAEPAPKKK